MGVEAGHDIELLEISLTAIPMYVNEAVGKVGPSRCQTAVPKRHLAQMVGPVVPEESDAVAH
jgi:hypothetical protein